MLLRSLIRFDSLINILLPRACLLCRSATSEPHHLCPPCARELPILSHSCVKCAQILSSGHELICGQCLHHPPPYTRVFALYSYEPPLPSLIAGLKFEAELSHASLFSTMMLHAIRSQWYPEQHLPDCIIPMPLHPSRLRERGYNQAAEIAKPIAQSLKIPSNHSLIRIKHTLPQSSLTAAERRQNTARAFSSLQSFEGMHIALIDDVMTTGSTICSAAAVLKAHGASRIDVWCCARRG